eukprot:scaffold41175_cov33-Tisochrysis_lutea.AAC.2
MCIRTEAALVLRVELVDSSDETKRAFLDQILNIDAPVGIFLRDGHDEPKVRSDHTVLGKFLQPCRQCRCQVRAQEKIWRRGMQDLFEGAAHERLATDFCKVQPTHHDP